MYKKQVVDNRNQSTDFLAFLDTDLVLHGDETAQMLLFEQPHGIRLSTVSGTHSIPYFGLSLRFHAIIFSEKGVPSGL